MRHVDEAVAVHCAAAGAPTSQWLSGWHSQLGGIGCSLWGCSSWAGCHTLNACCHGCSTCASTTKPAEQSNSSCSAIRLPCVQVDTTKGMLLFDRRQAKPAAASPVTHALTCNGDFLICVCLWLRREADMLHTRTVWLPFPSSLHCSPLLCSSAVFSCLWWRHVPLHPGVAQQLQRCRPQGNLLGEHASHKVSTGSGHARPQGSRPPELSLQRGCLRVWVGKGGHAHEGLVHQHAQRPDVHLGVIAGQLAGVYLVQGNKVRAGLGKHLQVVKQRVSGSRACSMLLCVGLVQRELGMC